MSFNFFYFCSMFFSNFSSQEVAAAIANSIASCSNQRQQPQHHGTGSAGGTASLISSSTVTPPAPPQRPQVSLGFYPYFSNNEYFKYFNYKPLEASLPVLSVVRFRDKQVKAEESQLEPITSLCQLPLWTLGRATAVLCSGPKGCKKLYNIFKSGIRLHI